MTRIGEARVGPDKAVLGQLPTFAARRVQAWSRAGGTGGMRRRGTPPPCRHDVGMPSVRGQMILKRQAPLASQSSLPENQPPSRASGELHLSKDGGRPSAVVQRRQLHRTRLAAGYSIPGRGVLVATVDRWTSPMAEKDGRPLNYPGTSLKYRHPTDTPANNPGPSTDRGTVPWMTPSNNRHTGKPAS